MRTVARASLACLCVVILAGCPWPTREDPFCLPKGKYNRDRHELYAGVRCAW